MANTTNYNFEKPAQTDYYDVEVQNNNWDKLDTELKKTNDNKQDTLVSGVSIKTINGESLLGSGNIFIKGGTSSDEVTAKRADVLKGKTTIMNDSADEIVEGTLEVQSIVNFNLSLYASETVMGAWQNPAKGPYSGVKVVYRTDRYPENPDDGTVAYEGSGISFTKTLPAGVKHFFAAFSYMTTNFGRIYLGTPAKAEFTTSKVQGRQVFKSNGTFTVPAGVYNIQVFAVGGGGGGANWFENESIGYAPGGGGGGKTVTKTLSVNPGAKYNVTIGGGGTPHVAGGASTFGGNLVSAAGGSQGANGRFQTYAGNGGSGGGGGGYAHGKTSYKDGKPGASDGANGASWDAKVAGGSGQGSTTREFGQSGATLYAGGGGGGGTAYFNYSGSYVYWEGKGGAGGAGGGGRGGDAAEKGSQTATHGSANSGGGGGSGGVFDGMIRGLARNGGSGIVIVRWGY